MIFDKPNARRRAAPDAFLMWIARTIEQARTARRELSSPVALVPTMGALHKGHRTLIRSVQQQADHVIVSIFVNPMQFAPHEDFDRYPRPIEDDLDVCREENVAGVFTPDVAQMYPPDVQATDVFIPEMGDLLEGALRSQFFHGVCRVVLKLFNILTPDVAVFGQKDYQQWRLIEAMADDLNLPIRILGSPTVREADGLALSSRNVYLTREKRPSALSLYKALQAARMLIQQAGETNPQAVEGAMTQLLQSHGAAVDYAVVRHPRTLAPIESIDLALTGAVVALVAARVGPVRLIDNLLIDEK